MKPTHWLALLALLSVAGVLLILFGSNDSEREARVDEERELTMEFVRIEKDTPELPAAGKDEGPLAEGSTGFTVAVAMPDGTPAAGASLEIRGPFGTRSKHAAREDGTLVVRDIARGPYSLLATRGDAVGARNFRLDEPRDLGTLRLSEALVVRGRVFDAQYAPLQGATVEAIVATEPSGFLDLSNLLQRIAEPEPVAARTTTGRDGAYQLHLPGAGEYSFRAAAPEFGQETEARQPVHAAVSDFDFHLFPAVAVSGRVLDERGRPVDGAHIYASSPAALLMGGIPKAEAISKANGEFLLSLSSARGSDYILLVHATGFAVHLNDDLDVPSHDLRIVLHRGLTLRMKVIDADTKRPVPDVNVAVIQDEGLANGVSNPAGVVLIENLPEPGSAGLDMYKAMLEADGYISALVDLTGLEVKDGVLDAGVVALERGGTVRGIVRDKATGKGIAGAAIRTFGGLEDDLEMMGGANTKTRRDGTFELRGVSLKTAKLIATHRDYLSSLTMIALMEMGMDEHPKPIFPEGETEIDQELFLEPGARVLGVVVGPDGKPVAGARVTFELEEMMQMMLFMTGQVPRAISGPDGTFTLGPIEKDKDVTVTAAHRDFGKAERVATKAGSGARITIKLERPRTVTGLVVDESGEPIAGVQVGGDTMAGEMDREEEFGELLGSSTRPGITGADGRFSLRNAPKGEYAIFYRHLEYKTEDRLVKVRSGTTDSGRMVMKRGAGILGVVQDPAGRPISGVLVNVNFVGESEPAVTTGRASASVRTNERGRFAFHGLAPAQFTLTVSHDDFYAEPRKLETGPDEVRIRLEKAGILKGLVLADGKPVAGASVYVKAADGTAPSVRQPSFTRMEESGSIGYADTNRDGSFHIRRLPPRAALVLVIQHDSYRTLTVSGVAASENAQEYHLSRGRVLHGQVVDTAGRPVEGIHIAIVDDDDYRQATTDSKGHFVLSGLEAEPLELHLQESGLGYLEAKLELGPADDTPRFVAVMGESIFGKVEQGSKGAEFVAISAFDENGNEVREEWIWGSGGEFKLRGLKPGRYTIRAELANQGGEAGKRAEAVGVATGTTDLLLRFPE